MNSLSYEVAIDYPLFQASKGLYYIGQTPSISSLGQNVLAMLRNPNGSEHLLFVNSITITNFSSSSLLAEFYLRACLNEGIISTNVSCTNTGICPIPFPVGTIEYFETPPDLNNNGVSIFSRIVPPQSTLVIDGGQIILGSSQSLSVLVRGVSSVLTDGIRVAFGWSEDLGTNK